MSNLSKIVSGLLFLAFVSLVIYSTTGLAQYSCKACIEYKGRTDCGTASGTSEEEAVQTAISVACANLSSGVTESIECSNTKPISVECRQK